MTEQAEYFHLILSECCRNRIGKRVWVDERVRGIWRQLAGRVLGRAAENMVIYSLNNFHELR